ncbi:MAG: type IV pilin protein [Steroidobacteraceae bacterium]|jgi:type IV pilus assembly protein PilE
MSKQFPSTAGFTLIELMVTVAISAILVTIATASYSAFTLKAHRAEAKSALLDLAGLEERYLSTNNSYSQTPSDLGYTAANWPGVLIGSGYYEVQGVAVTAPVLSLVAGVPSTPASFAITLIPVPGSVQVNDTACASFTVTSQGARTATMLGGADNTATCWQ